MPEAIATLVALGALAAVSTAHDETAPLAYVGSPAVARFVDDAMRHYDGPVLRLAQERGRSAACLWQDSCAMAVVAGPIGDRVLARGVVATWLATEAVALVTHPANDLAGLSLAEFEALRRGELTDWADLGAPPRPLRWLEVQDGDVRCEEALLQRLADDPDAIGLVGAGMLASAPPLQVLALDGAKPEVGADDYALQRDLFLLTKGEPPPTLAAFVAWTRTVAGQALVEARFLGLE
ncbi:MAG: hypothetical protein EA356_05760 [Geminicoccaceae bacterium]|nr:MAG: hypothetical protein EA356_05760 [Geminicoccaceae bacterium]